jgi:hypothetical protein
VDQKKCFKCGEVKSLAEFYNHPKMADGRMGKCIECTKKDVRENRDRRADYYREYDRSRAMRPDRVAARCAYQSTPAGRHACRRAKKRWQESNAIKRAAQIQVGNAVRDGRLQKSKECEVCGKAGRIHGHHDDYGFPLSVRWLCPGCHNRWHKEHGEARNG